MHATRVWIPSEPRLAFPRDEQSLYDETQVSLEINVKAAYNHDFITASGAKPKLENGLPARLQA
jgi:hypothetical protein